MKRFRVTVRLMSNKWCECQNCTEAQYSSKQTVTVVTLAVIIVFEEVPRRTKCMGNYYGVVWTTLSDGVGEQIGQ